YLVSSDVLLLFIFKEEDSKAAIPGKVYEYIAARKPIIAFCPKSSAAAELLSGIGVEDIVDPEDVKAMASIIERYARNMPYSVPDYPIERFDRRHNTGVLCAHLESIVDR